MKKFSNRYGSLFVSEETVDVEWLNHPLVVRYTITTPTGYIATIEACASEECESGTRTACPRPRPRPLGVQGQHSVNGKTSVDAWLRHSQTACHGWHREKVYAFAESVLSTFGYRHKLPVSVGAPRGDYDFSLLAYPS